MKKYLIVFSLIFFSSNIYNINIKLLKSTINVLPEDQRFYELVWGLPFIENGISENIYDFSRKNVRNYVLQEIASPINKSPEAVAAKADVLKYVDELKSSYTEQLATILFNRAGGNFMETTAPGNIATYLKPEQIGSILRLIYQDQKNLSRKVFEKEKQGKENIKNKQKSGNKKVEINDLEKKISQYIASLKIQKKGLPGQAFAANDKEVKVFAKAVVGSFLECDGNNADASYAPNTTCGMLLSFVLKKSNNKQDLQDYYKGFLGKDIVLADDDYTDADMIKFLAIKPSLFDYVEFANFLCAEIYNKSYKSELPKIASGRSFIFDEVSFPDCVETMMRNVCNILTYDLNTKMLGQAPKDIVLNNDLQSFYTKKTLIEKEEVFLNNNPAEVENIKVHEDWGNVVENHLYVSYNRLKEPKSKDYIWRPEGCDGFIHIDVIDNALPEHKVIIGKNAYVLYDKIIGTKKYLLVPKQRNLLCFEIMPTLSNVIVLLNDLFNLNLFENSQIFNQDFSEKTFPLVCKKLGWHFDKPVFQEIKNFEEGKQDKIEIEINLMFSINLEEKRHGYVGVVSKTKEKKVYEIITSENYKNFPVQTAAMLSLFGNQKLLKEFGKDNINTFSKLFSYVKFQSVEERLYVIEMLLSLRYGNHIIDEYLKKLILKSLVLQDEFVTNRIYFFIENKNNEFLITENLWKELFIIDDISLVKFGTRRNFVLLKNVFDCMKNPNSQIISKLKLINSYILQCKYPIELEIVENLFNSNILFDRSDLESNHNIDLIENIFSVGLFGNSIHVETVVFDVLYWEIRNCSDIFKFEKIKILAINLIDNLSKKDRNKYYKSFQSIEMLKLLRIFVNNKLFRQKDTDLVFLITNFLINNEDFCGLGLEDHLIEIFEILIDNNEMQSKYIDIIFLFIDKTFKDNRGPIFLLYYVINLITKLIYANLIKTDDVNQILLWLDMVSMDNEDLLNNRYVEQSRVKLLRESVAKCIEGLISKKLLTIDKTNNLIQKLSTLENYERLLEKLQIYLSSVPVQAKHSGINQVLYGSAQKPNLAMEPGSAAITPSALFEAKRNIHFPKVAMPSQDQLRLQREQMERFNDELDQQNNIQQAKLNYQPVQQYVMHNVSQASTATKFQLLAARFKNSWPKMFKSAGRAIGK